MNCGVYNGLVHARRIGGSYDWWWRNFGRPAGMAYAPPSHAGQIQAPPYVPPSSPAPDCPGFGQTASWGPTLSVSSAPDGSGDIPSYDYGWQCQDAFWLKGAKYAAPWLTLVGTGVAAYALGAGVAGTIAAVIFLGLPAGFIVDGWLFPGSLM